MSFIRSSNLTLIPICQRFFPHKCLLRASGIVVDAQAMSISSTQNKAQCGSSTRVV
jgi:hypothetical protein